VARDHFDALITDARLGVTTVAPDRARRASMVKLAFLDSSIR
jgi:hypothetical protein